MNCDRCHSNLISFLEGSLKEMDFHDMEDHLKECPSCHGFADYLQKTFATIESSRITEPDPYFYTRVKARIEKQEEFLPAKPGFVRILQPVVFSLLLIVAIYGGIKIGSSDWSPKTNSYVMEDLDPWMNELGSEPIETFLMDE